MLCLLVIACWLLPAGILSLSSLFFLLVFCSPLTFFCPPFFLSFLLSLSLLPFPLLCHTLPCLAFSSPSSFVAISSLNKNHHTNALSLSSFPQQPTGTHPLFDNQLENMAVTDGLVPQRQAPPPPRPSTSSSKSLSLQLSAGSVPQSPASSYGSTPASPLHVSEHNINPKETSTQPQVSAPPRVPPPKKGPPPPQKPSRHNDYRSPQDAMRSYPTENTISLTTHHNTSSPKSSYSSRSHHNYDSSSEYSSNRSTFKGVFSNIVNSMTGTALVPREKDTCTTNHQNRQCTRCKSQRLFLTPCFCSSLAHAHAHYAPVPF